MKLRGIALAGGLLLWLCPGVVAPTAHAQDYPGGIGVGTYLHPLNLPCCNFQDRCLAIPEAQRDQVHFFVVNGFDPSYIGNLNGVAEYIHQLGFRNTRLFYLYQFHRAEDEIRAVKQCNPNARIVLLGYSWGTNAVRCITHKLGEEGICIDSLIYLGGDTIMNCPHSRPANARNILNITGNGLIFLGYNLYFKGDDIDGADNRRLHVRHMLLPSRTETITWITDEVMRVATAPDVQVTPTTTTNKTPLPVPPGQGVSQVSHIPSLPPVPVPAPRGSVMPLPPPPALGSLYIP